MPGKTYQSYRVEVPEKYSEVLTHFYVARNDTATAVNKKLIPSFQALLVFNFGVAAQVQLEGLPDMHTGKCLLFGPIKKQLSYLVHPGTELLVVNLKDDACYRLFGQVMFNMNAPLHPDNILETDYFEQLWHRLSPMDTTEKRIQALLEFCESHLQARNPIAAQLAGFSDETQNEVKAVALDMNVSERTVQVAYKKQFGFTSKEKQRYQRFVKVIAELQNTTETVDWQDVAYRFGYYDQSHLIHDFNYYLGISPEQYLKTRQNSCMGNL